MEAYIPTVKCRAATEILFPTITYWHFEAHLRDSFVRNLNKLREHGFLHLWDKLERISIRLGKRHNIMQEKLKQNVKNAIGASLSGTIKTPADDNSIVCIKLHNMFSFLLIFSCGKFISIVIFSMEKPIEIVSNTSWREIVGGIVFGWNSFCVYYKQPRFIGI